MAQRDGEELGLYNNIYNIVILFDKHIFLSWKHSQKEDKIPQDPCPFPIIYAMSYWKIALTSIKQR